MSKNNNQQNLHIKATSEGIKETKKEVEDLKNELKETEKASEKAAEAGDFNAFSTAVRTAAISTQFVVSGLALIGVEGDKVAKTLLQVQATMAFADSISQFTEMWGEIKTLGNVIKSWSIVTKAQTVAQGILNAVMSANPIGLVIAAVAALVAIIGSLLIYGDDLLKWFKGMEDPTDILTASTEKLTKANKDLNEAVSKGRKEREASLNHEYAMAKASGASEKELRKLELKLIDIRIKEENRNITKAAWLVLMAKEALAQAEKDEADEKAIEKAKEALKVAQETVNALSDSVNDMHSSKSAAENRFLVEDAQKKTDHNRKVAEDNKEAAKKEAERKSQEYKDRLQAERDYEDQLQEIRLKKVQDQLDALAEKDALLKEYNEGTELEKLEAKKIADEAILEAAGATEDERLELEHYYAQEKARIGSEALATKKALEDEELQNELAVLDAKAQNQMTVVDNVEAGMSLLKDAFGESKEMQKAALIAENAAAIAKIAINTQLAVSKAITINPAFGGMPMSGFAIASGILGVVSAVKATTKGLKDLGGGSVDSGGAEAMANGPQMTGSTGPQVDFQAPGASQIGGTLSQSGGQLPPVKAYVVSKDMTNQQEADRYMKESNTI